MPQSEPDTTLQRIQRHPRYYLNDGDLYFIADGQLFRLHRYFFERESPVFRQKFELTAPSGGLHCGDDESVAILLDISAVDFEKLLGVFYNPRYTLYDWAIEDWTTILKLADKWQFDEVKDLATRELENLTMSILPRIVLYQQYRVDDKYLVPLYGILCSRPEALDNDESTLIGLKTTVLIFRAREQLRAQPSDEGRSPLPAGRKDEDVHRTIKALLDCPSKQPADPAMNISRTSSRSIFTNSNGRTGRPVGPVRKYTVT